MSSPDIRLGSAPLDLRNPWDVEIYLRRRDVVDDQVIQQVTEAVASYLDTVTDLTPEELQTFVDYAVEYYKTVTSSESEAE